MRKVALDKWWDKDAALQTWWENWLEEAKQATDDIILLWEKSRTITQKNFKPRIWGDLKANLLKHVFHGKCAYCETDLKGARQSGHGEHYRPKLSPNYRPPDNSSAKYLPATVRYPASSTDDHHPGYFWLAYDWRNLLPSCELCNTSGGKGNQFPLEDQKRYTLLVKLETGDSRIKEARPSKSWPGYYYLAPKDLDSLERPQLIHPGFMDPREHLVFDELGNIAPRSDMGQHTITVCRLTEPGLYSNRQKSLELAISRIMSARVNELKNGYTAGVQAAAENLVEAVTGKAEYSAAILAACEIHGLNPIIEEAYRQAGLPVPTPVSVISRGRIAGSE